MLTTAKEADFFSDHPTLKSIATCIRSLIAFAGFWLARGFAGGWRLACRIIAGKPRSHDLLDFAERWHDRSNDEELSASLREMARRR